MSTPRIPQPGEPYFSGFEDEWDGSPDLKIESVHSNYEDGGFAIFADDGVGYDCYWSEKHQCWCYFPDKPDEPE